MTTPAPNKSNAEVLTIEEAAALLRIGRNAAYALARQWRATDGREGLPCIQLGRSLRVPRAALDQLLRASSAKAPGEGRSSNAA